ncbi:alternate-type signal peptide domain-containing protein [Mycetocola spongiae]|uniref:alternate-type signal peptide domain-containing protein n=1 Tax=Mycetocola spongiae TaxID=2859226 RepID=UPI001CF56B4B|nr:alternate-type signal peptide domain-containing protein [Mycetocola spongiae]UCR88404.1 alternate-type signal peptide domain-containing protein [Mycetocola spongiae]
MRRNLLLPVIAAVLGAALLLGGEGTMASWTDTRTATPVKISSGSLDLGPIGASAMTWTLAQEIPGRPASNAVPFTGQALVPGDVLTATVNVPVSLVGQNLVADLALSRLSVTPTGKTAADAAFAASLGTRIISINGQAPAPASPGSVTLRPGIGATVPVVVAVSLPWSATGSGSASVILGMDYTLTQRPAGATS